MSFIGLFLFGLIALSFAFFQLRGQKEEVIEEEENEEECEPVKSPQYNVYDIAYPLFDSPGVPSISPDFIPPEKKSLSKEADKTTNHTSLDSDLSAPYHSNELVLGQTIEEVFGNEID